MEFVILDTGDAARFAGKLEKSALDASNFSEPMVLIQTDIFRVEEAIFSSGGRRGGGSWKRLNQEYADRKGTTAILVDTGALKRSVTEPGASYQILQITPHQLMFGTERPWAFVHQYGSKTGGIPRRPFIRFLPNDVDRWARILLDHVTKSSRV